MAVVFVEGFDTYNGMLNTTASAVGLAARWTASYATGSMVAGRFGGQGYRHTLPGDTNSVRLPGTYSSGCVGFALNAGAGFSTGAGWYMFSLSYGGNTNTSAITNNPHQFAMTITGGLQIQIYRGTTLLGTSTTTLTAGAWAYIEIEFVISDTVGEIRVYLNNDPTPVINLSGIDSKGETTSGVQFINVSSLNVGSGQMIYDDMYFVDTPNRLGEQRIITSYPDSDVLTTYWSSSTSGAAPYTMIDEAQCDGDTTYVSSNTTNSRIVTGVPSLPVPPVSVNAVQITGFARKDETQLRQLALEYQNTAGSVATGPTYTLGTSYSYINDLMPQNPLTGTAWTGTDVNSMRIGARVVS